MPPSVEELMLKQAEQHVAATAFISTQADAIDSLAQGLMGVLALCSQHAGGAVPVERLLAVVHPAVLKTNEAVLIASSMALKGGNERKSAAEATEQAVEAGKVVGHA